MSAPVDILERAPLRADALAKWLGEINAEDFDSVCVSASVLTLDDELRDSAFVSTRSIALLMTAIRDRYRELLGQKKEKKSFRVSSKKGRVASINREQARIIWRLPHEHAAEYARMLGIHRNIIYSIWGGVTWKEFGRREAA